MSHLDKMRLVDRLVQVWGNCEKCRLHERRNAIVHWRGNPSAHLLLIGEAPGVDEDREGRPFVGRAGRLLDELLVLARLDPCEDVIITNMVACRPPGNRVPQRDELKACRPRLSLFIRIVNPRLIVLLGATAAKLAGVHSVFGHRGSKCEVELDDITIPAIPTFHPSFLLRTNNVEHKNNLVHDLKLAWKLSVQ
jgi:uracil-DNA glycosylase family 4